MVYLPLEELLPKAGLSSYKLVALASKRALEIAGGAPKMVDSHMNEKTATTALREIQAGRVYTKEEADRLAKEKKTKASKG